MSLRYRDNGSNISVNTTDDLMGHFLSHLFGTREEIRKQNSSAVSFVAMIQTHSAQYIVSTNTQCTVHRIYKHIIFYRQFCILSSTVYIAIFFCSKHLTSTLQMYIHTFIYIYIYIYIQGAPKVGIQYIVYYCIPTFGQKQVYSIQYIVYYCISTFGPPCIYIYRVGQMQIYSIQYITVYLLLAHPVYIYTGWAKSRYIVYYCIPNFGPPCMCIYIYIMHLHEQSTLDIWTLSIKGNPRTVKANQLQRRAM